MADTDGVSVRVSADSTGLSAGLAQATTTLAQATEKMQGGFSGLQTHVGSLKGGLETLAGPVMKMTGLFAGLAAVAVGGAFKAMIDESKRMTGEATKLAGSLGITTTEAAALNTALGDIGSDAETYSGAMQHFARQLKSNEDGLQAMGLKTRDASGHLRDSKALFSESLGIVGTYKQGLDQTTAAMTFFGRNTDDAMKLMKLSPAVIEEARKKNEELGLTITKNNVEASKAYKAATNDLNDVMSALKKTIGDAVMPVFTELAQWLSSIGPAAVVVLRTTMESLVAVFRMAQGAVVLLKDWFVGAFTMMSDMAGSFGRVMMLVVKGEYAQAWEEAKKGVQQYRVNVQTTWDQMVEDAKKANDKIAAAVTRDTSGGANVGKSGSNTMGAMGGNKTRGADIAKQQADAIAAMQREIIAVGQVTEAEKVAWEIENGKFKAFDDHTKRTLLLLAQTKDAQAAIAIATKAQAEAGAEAYREMEERRKQEFADFVREEKALDDAAEGWRKVIDPTRTYVQQLEQIRDLLKRGKLNPDEAAEAEFDVQGKMQDMLDSKAIKPKVDAFTGTIESAFNRLWGSIRQGTLTMRGLFVGAFEFAANIVQGSVTKMAADWISKTLVAKMSSIKTALSDIEASAARAGAAAFASTAAIPIVGPELAPAAAAASYAGAMSFASGLTIAAAERGWDVPAGMNPITQLHQREMVLPAEHADVIRDLAGGGPAPGGDVHLHVHSPDTDGVRRFLFGNQRQLADAMRSAVRNGYAR